MPEGGISVYLEGRKKKREREKKIRKSFLYKKIFISLSFSPLQLHALAFITAQVKR